MKQKVLSVTIPTWNRDKLLSELLNILIEQIESDSLQDKIELLISNNGSIDHTEEVVLNLCKRYPYITYINNGINKGARFNVLQCLDKASGEFVILFGDDDRLSPGSLKKI